MTQEIDRDKKGSSENRKDFNKSEGADYGEVPLSYFENRALIAELHTIVAAEMKGGQPYGCQADQADTPENQRGLENALFFQKQIPEKKQAERINNQR